MIELDVPLGDRTYPVLVGDGARHRLLEVLPDRRAAGGRRDPGVIGVAVDPGVEHRVFTIGDGEDDKDLGTVEDLCRDFARWGLTRGDVVVAVGGGVVTDAGRVRGGRVPPRRPRRARRRPPCSARSTPPSAARPA